MPKLWRSEFRNVLAGFLRREIMGPDMAKALVRAAEAELGDFECEIDSVAVMELVSGCDCSAYDCEFVALASSMGVPLVTEDKGIRRDFPGIAVGMAALIARPRTAGTGPAAGPAVGSTRVTTGHGWTDGSGELGMARSPAVPAAAIRGPMRCGMVGGPAVATVEGQPLR